MKNNLSILVIVIVLSLDEIYAQSTVKLIPIPEALTFGPKTHERLTVPVEPSNNNLIPIPEALVVGPRAHEKIIVPVLPIKEQNEKKSIQIQAPSKVKTVVENPILIRKNLNDVQIIQPKPIVLVNRYNGKNAVKPVISVQKMQPLHITMKGLRQSKPNHTRESVEEKRQRFKAQEERIKMEKLPPNPDEVPRTSWFDNLGKYNYGIVHEIKYEDLPTLEEITDTAEGESKEVVSKPAPRKSVQIHQPEMIFRSSFRDPKLFAEIHSQNDNMGKFLYNTQVYYPNYRDHIYLPVTTFYGQNNPNTKDLPIFNAHTIIHNQNESEESPQKPPPVNPRKHPTVAPRRHPQEPVKKQQNLPRRIPPPPPKKSPPEPPKKYHPNKSNNVPKKDPPKKLPPPPKKQEPKETEEDYDYEEDDDEDYDDSTNDKHTDNSDDDDDEESEEEEDSNESRERGGGKKSYRSRDSDESNESGDAFDNAWSKYGYGKHKNKKSSESEEDEDSYESSESQTQPERIKIYHMKMEVQTTPLGDDDVDEESSNIETPELDKKKKPKNAEATNQKPHPNAGPDDLKYFQYINYLGNGEHLAGGRFGNDNHYIEQHERSSKPLGVFQKKVKWADKEGGFGEHYWDLNHG